jgi:hypothetical protein
MRTPSIVPAVWDEEHEQWQEEPHNGRVGPMMGGNYAATSDSRFSEATGQYGAIAIHDRYETPEQYISLSN